MTDITHSPYKALALPAALIASVLVALIASYLLLGPSSKVFLVMQFSVVGGAVMSLPASVTSFRLGSPPAKAIAALILSLPVALLLISYLAHGLRSPAFIVAAFGCFGGAVTLAFQGRS